MAAGNTSTNLVQSSNVTYFSKKFVDNLKTQTPFLALADVLDQPLNSGINHRIHMYGDTSTGKPFAANVTQATEGTPLTSSVVAGVLKADFTVGEYADFASFSSLSLYTALDNVVLNVGKEMSYRLGESLSAIARAQFDGLTAVDSSVAVKLPATSTSVYTTISRGALAAAIQSLAGRNVRPFNGEGYLGVIHPFAVGDLLTDSGAVVDILKRTDMGLKRLEEISSGDFKDVIEIPGVNCKFFQTSNVTISANYNPGGGAITGLSALRAYIAGEGALYRVKMNAPGDTEYADGNYEGIKVYLEQNAKPTSYDPSSMIPGWCSYRVHFAAGPGPDKTARARFIDAASAVA